MKMIYLASVRIPNEKASGLAIMRQCAAFSELGHKVTLVRPNRKNHLINDPFKFYGLNKNFELATIPIIQQYLAFGPIGFYLTRISMMLSSAWYVWRHRFDFDVIYSRDQWLLFLIVLTLPRKKIIFEAHTKHENFATSFVIRCASLVVVISAGLKQFYRKYRGEKKVTVEPSGADVDQFKGLPAQAKVREKQDLPLTSFIYGYMGKYTTMGEAKGVDEVIEAFAAVYKDQPAAHLLIVGLEPSEMEPVRQIIKQLGLPDGSYTLRALDPKHFAEYAMASDVLVMNYPDTEHYRFFMSPSKLFAYLASGRPIIATNLPTINSLVNDCVVTLVPPGDTPALARAMQNERQRDLIHVTNQTRANHYSWLNRGRRIMLELNGSGSAIGL